jgi:hypothetical protein
LMHRNAISPASTARAQKGAPAVYRGSSSLISSKTSRAVPYFRSETPNHRVYLRGGAHFSPRGRILERLAQWPMQRTTDIQ